jgi:hypothetical protein
LTASTHASVVPETFVALDWFREVVTHLFDWSSSLSSSFVISIVFVAFTTRSQHFSPQDYTTATTFTTTPIRAEDDVSTRQHETMMNFLSGYSASDFFPLRLENGVHVVHVRERRLADDESFSFREFKPTRKRSEKLKSRRQSVVNEGEKNVRESRRSRFVLLFAFLFSCAKSRIIVR